MKCTWKKTVLFALTAVMALSLAACGQQGGDTPASGAQPASQSGRETSTPAPSAPDTSTPEDSQSPGDGNVLVVVDQGVQAVGHREGGAVLQPQDTKPPPGLFQRRRAHVADQPMAGAAEQERRAQPAMVRADVGKHPRARSQRHGGGKPPVQHGRAAKNPVSQGSP